MCGSIINCNPIKSSHLLHGAWNDTVINSTVSLRDTAIHAATIRFGDLIIGGDFVFVTNGNNLTLAQKNETANRSIKFELIKNKNLLANFNWTFINVLIFV